MIIWQKTPQGKTSSARVEYEHSLHKVNTILFLVSFPQLHVLQELALEADNYGFSSA